MNTAADPVLLRLFAGVFAFLAASTLIGQILARTLRGESAGSRRQ